MTLPRHFAIRLPCMTTLLTGFNRFGDLQLNPTRLIVEEFSRRNGPAGMNLVAEVMPTEFLAGGKRIVELIRQYRPDRIVCLGVAAGSDAIRLERVALNLDDCAIPDNAGLQLAGNQIIPDGPSAYWSTLPIDAMLAALQQRGIPTVISNHAGTFVCNHVFYLARHEIECLGLGTQCGFIHVPQISDAPAGNFTLDGLTAAIECCLRV